MPGAKAGLRQSRLVFSEIMKKKMFCFLFTIPFLGANNIRYGALRECSDDYYSGSSSFSP